MKELILGGARSGKSRLAEAHARASGRPVCYIATGTAGDEEMAKRIRQHQQQRPKTWRLVEEPLALADALRSHAGPEECVIVDCLTLWLSNTLAPAAAGLAADSDDVFARERAALLAVLPELRGHIILVSNEVGMGIVPLGEQARRFCDEAGRLHQDLAQICERVIWVVAGLPQILKGNE